MKVPPVSDDASNGLNPPDGQQGKQIPLKGLQESTDKHFETINAGLRNLHFRVLEIEEAVKFAPAKANAAFDFNIRKSLFAALLAVRASVPFDQSR